MSASSLLGTSSQNVIPNVASKNPLYNPSIPVIQDQNVRSLRNINLKDRFYLDNAIDGVMKNNDGLSLGPNNKFLRRNDYDRQIDPNYLRRENPKNKKHTDPDDFYNGSQLAYFELPKRIPRAVPQDLFAGINSMDMYQYGNRFINTPASKPQIQRPNVPGFMDQSTSGDIISNIGTDPTNDPAILERIKRQKEESERRRYMESTQKAPFNFNDYDEYGNLKNNIRDPIKINQINQIPKNLSGPAV